MIKKGGYKQHTHIPEMVCETCTRARTHKLTRRDDVEKVFELIHPDFRQASVVFVDDLSRPSRKRVGRGLSEHVAHVRARDDLQSPAALPNLQSTNQCKVSSACLTHCHVKSDRCVRGLTPVHSAGKQMTQIGLGCAVTVGIDVD